MPSWTLKIQVGKDVHAVEVSEDARLEDLRVAVEEATGVFARQQKLIFKGKVLEGDRQLLGDLKLKDGAKVLLVSGASGVATGGQAAARAAVKQRSEEAKARLAAGLPSKATQSRGSGQTVTLADRASGWSKTGVVSLRDEGLTAVPDAAWSVGAAVRVADLGDNGLQGIEAAGLGKLPNLQRLRLAGNALAAVPWATVASLTALVQLDLSRNQLTAVAAEVGGCRALQVLSLRSNQLTRLPDELCQLSVLRELDVSDNRLEELPAGMGRMSALQSIRMGNNRLRAVPEELSQLASLTSISLPANRISTIPTAVLVGCSSLRNLDVHSNPVTVQQLRELEGWDVFDARRRKACDKAIESRVFGGTKGFDEGADEQEWRRWG